MSKGEGHVIIALSREYGSGGREIGAKLADRLGIRKYDDNIVELAAKRSGIKESYFTKVDEKPTDSFLYMLAMNTLSMGSAVNPYDNTLSSDKLFNIQSEVITEIAQREDCVFVGRCAGYILRNEPNLVTIYLTADESFKLPRIMEREKCDEKEALRSMKRVDKKRESYYGYYAGEDWKACATYDLVIDTGKLGIDRSVDLIETYLKMRFG